MFTNFYVYNQQYEISEISILCQFNDISVGSVLFSLIFGVL